MRAAVWLVWLGVLGLGVLGLGGCAIGQRPLTVPPNDRTTVLLVTGSVHPFEDMARHPWFAIRRAGEKEWKIYEVRGGGSEANPFQNSPYISPILHGVWRGPAGERAAACLDREAPPWLRTLQYRGWPGPNSNTFADVMLRRCRLRASLPATAIGKDWRGWVGASRTTEGTGVQVELSLVGLRIGLREGIEVHVLGLPFGIDLWPPAIIVPLGPGRIGFADR